MTFKILALAPQIQARDAGGALLCYVWQKLFRLKEAVTVYRDEAQETRILLAVLTMVLMERSRGSHWKPAPA